jgi:hypothetical protein
MRSWQMNAAAVRTAGRYLGVWAGIALFVGLVSFTFTFLGAMACAVLAGMMMGAFKGPRWFPVMVSLVFPMVVFGMTRGAQAALTPQQVLLLVALSFGTFWMTYVVSAFLFFCEQKDKKAPRPRAASLPQEPLAQSRQAAATSLPAAESRLEQLQGDWVCEAVNAREPMCRKVIQIKEAHLELKAIDGSGRTTLLAEGEVRLQGSPPS